jgi:hypothetical protein
VVATRVDDLLRSSKRRRNIGLEVRRGLVVKPVSSLWGGEVGSDDGQRPHLHGASSRPEKALRSCAANPHGARWRGLAVMRERRTFRLVEGPRLDRVPHGAKKRVNATKPERHPIPTERKPL